MVGIMTSPKSQKSDFSRNDLEAYLDEALPVDDMTQIEQLLRTDKELARRLTEIIRRRDLGVHSIGDIWRRHRLTCPSREQLGALLMGALKPEDEDYIRFHLETVGCRACRANFDDLKARQAETEETVHVRRRRYFQSSAGYLKSEE